MDRLTKEDLKDIVTGDLFKGFLSPELAVRKWMCMKWGHTQALS